MDPSEGKPGGGIKMKRHIPSGHPLKEYLRWITFYIFDETGVRDNKVAGYVSEMLADFAHADNVYRIMDMHGRKLEYLVDMLAVSETLGPVDEREARRHIGDYCMFTVGIFPESIDKGGRRPVSPSLYVEQGKRAYLMVSESDRQSGEAVFFNKLADKFELCVNALFLEREYLFDPFYQYLLRQMEH